MTERKATAEEIKRIQEALRDRGLYAGEVDGIPGPVTREGIIKLQAEMGLAQTGVLTGIELKELGLVAKPAPKKSNPITSFLVRKGVEIVVSNILKGIPGMNILAGYKTYILAALILLSAAGETFVGIDVPGFEMSLGDAIMVALGLFTARFGAKADVKALK